MCVARRTCRGLGILAKVSLLRSYTFVFLPCVVLFRSCRISQSHGYVWDVVLWGLSVCWGCVVRLRHEQCGNIGSWGFWQFWCKNPYLKKPSPYSLNLMPWRTRHMPLRCRSSRMLGTNRPTVRLQVLVVATSAKQIRTSSSWKLGKIQILNIVVF